MSQNQEQLHFVDVHAHMADHAFDDDLKEVLSRSQQMGVIAVLTVSETVDEARRIVEMATRFEAIKPCAGLYPTILDRGAAATMTAFIREHRDVLVAVGEVGLDYWVVKEEGGRAVQREIFIDHIRVARELDLPLNVHSRSAGRHAISVLREHGARNVLMHAFDGKVAAAMVGVEEGYFFSIPPSVVRSPQKQKLVRRLPLERLLLESDAPVLGPNKGVRNEPHNVAMACATIAKLKAVSPQEVAQRTTENAVRLFPRAFG
jgi:TatD DNase family protein